MYPLPWIAVEKVYFSVNKPKENWCLAELKIRTGVVTFYDSLGWAGGSKRHWDVTRVYRPKDIIKDLNIEFNIDVSYKRAWKRKQLALESNQGDPVSSFAQLPYYCYNLKLTNENIVTHIDTDHKGRFKMLFIAFGAAVRI
ncbi:hypothetical protein Tco_0497548 [Tanacetum coccineum]